MKIDPKAKTDIDARVAMGPRRMAKRSLLAALVVVGTVAGFGSAAMAQTRTEALPPPPNGWLVAPSTYLGRYNLVKDSVSAGSKASKINGALVLFIQVEFPGKPGEPAGIISFHTGKGTNVFYLTELDHHGTQLVASVHGGAFVAPVTGSLTVSKLSQGLLIGTLKQQGLATQQLTFERFSKNPLP